MFSYSLLGNAKREGERAHQKKPFGEWRPSGTPFQNQSKDESNSQKLSPEHPQRKPSTTAAPTIIRTMDHQCETRLNAARAPSMAPTTAPNEKWIQSSELRLFRVFMLAGCKGRPVHGLSPLQNRIRSTNSIAPSTSVSNPSPGATAASSPPPCNPLRAPASLRPPRRRRSRMAEP